MNVDAIKNGIVLDHIQAGRGMQIYHLLHLDTLSCPVAIIKNVQSKQLGKKDIIKIDADIPLDLDILGYIDPNITINVIRDSVLVEKKHLELPLRLVGVLKCRNPRCITSSEQELPQVFKLSDRQSRTYRCMYCEAKAEE
ncbi:MAG: aspartate carbamoyltransferase regulatory subunit [Eubacteriales bacterium]